LALATGYADKTGSDVADSKPITKTKNVNEADTDR